MSQRILQLETARRAARVDRDNAQREVRALRTGTSREVHTLASCLIEELREQSRERRNRTFDSVETYFQWLNSAAMDCTAEICSIEGEAAKLALAELRLVVANDTVCAINRELTRLQCDHQDGFVNAGQGRRLAAAQ